MGNIGDGVLLQGGSDNRIGTNADGTADASERNIISNNQTGIAITSGGTGNTIAGNYIGTDMTGEVDFGNLGDGVDLAGGATANTIGGSTAAARNVISGNSGDGVKIIGAGSDNNTIAGNFIGIKASGNAALANGGHGVEISSGANNLIGGSSAEERNIISGNTGDGVRISGPSATGNMIRGNYIGTNSAGTSAVGNIGNGITVYQNQTIIGGTQAGEGNVISGNLSDGVIGSPTGFGVWLQSANNTVQGNFIGTNATGTAALANAQSGIRIVGGNNLIGGTTDEARNIISGNTWNGIYMTNPQSTGNTIQGNYIGTDVTGLQSLANVQVGVNIDVGASGNLIGGDDAADGTVDGVVHARNIISGNHSEVVIANSSTGNVISGNYLGLGVDGVTPIAGTASGINIGADGNTVGGTTAARGT